MHTLVDLGSLVMGNDVAKQPAGDDRGFVARLAVPTIAITNEGPFFTSIEAQDAHGEDSMTKRTSSAQWTDSAMFMLFTWSSTKDMSSAPQIIRVTWGATANAETLVDTYLVEYK